MLSVSASTMTEQVATIPYIASPISVINGKSKLRMLSLPSAERSKNNFATDAEAAITAAISVAS